MCQPRSGCVVGIKSITAHPSSRPVHTFPSCTLVVAVNLLPLRHMPPMCTITCTTTSTIHHHHPPHVCGSVCVPPVTPLCGQFGGRYSINTLNRECTHAETRAHVLGVAIVRLQLGVLAAGGAGLVSFLKQFHSC